MHELDQERIVPWGDSGLYAWHLARYQFASTFAIGKRILDVGCGEGYGAACLARSGREVIAIDYSNAAIRHAQSNYQLENLRFEVGDATRLDPALGRFDLVTCFEVIEHVHDDAPLLNGLACALTPTGMLLLSTPNAVVDGLFESVSRHEHFAYHVNLLSPHELERRLRRYFARVALYGQSYRGRGIYTLLKAFDIFNLRHRLIRWPRAQDAIAVGMGRTDVRTIRPEDFHFSRWLVRQAPQTMALARP